MAGTPTWAHAIADAIESALLEVHTAMVCQVQTYDPDTQLADLVPQIKRPLENLKTGAIEHEEFPVIPNVKISFPRSDTFFLSFPIKAGSFVLVIFNEYSLDQWREKGRVTEPGDIGHLTMQGALAIPLGPYPEAQALTQAHADNLVLGEEDGVQLHMKPGGTAEFTSGGEEDADDFVAQSGKVSDELTAVKNAISGAVVLAGDGGAVFKSNILAALSTFPNSVASSNLKADD